MDGPILPRAGNLSALWRLEVLSNGCVASALSIDRKEIVVGVFRCLFRSLGMTINRPLTNSTDLIQIGCGALRAEFSSLGMK